MVNTAPLHTGAMAVYNYDPLIEARLVVQTKFDEIISLTKVVGEHLFVPRHLTYSMGKDKRSTGTKVAWPKFNPPPPRHSEQARVLEESLALLKADKSHIAKASTGFGKTYIGATLAAKLGYKTLVVVTKEDLLGEKQWRGAFKKFAGLKDSDIGIIRQGKCEVSDKIVCLALVHSLAKDKYPKWIHDDFGFVIFDEVHRMGAATFSTVCGMFNSKLRYGLSAGASGKKGMMRVDLKDFIFESHIGPVSVIAEFIPESPKVLVISTPWKIPMVSNGDAENPKIIPLPHEAGKVGHILVSLSKSSLRNQMVVELALKAWQRGRFVVVCSDLARDKHLDRLYGMAKAAGVPESDMGFYVGGMKEADREAAKKKHLVWATYGMVGEGTDVPWWDTMILGTPRANVKQAIGRVLREHPGKLRPMIVDLVDQESYVFSGYFKSRLALYNSSEIGAEVILTHLTNPAK